VTYPKLLRAVDERLFVGPMGAILAPPAGLQWVGWVDLVEAEVRSEYPALARQRDTRALSLRPEALFRTSIRDGVDIAPKVFARALGAYRAAQGAVLVSCAAGLSRSPSVAYAILRRALGIGHEEAVRRVSVEGWTLEGTAPLASARAWAEAR
jgi:hypothetical protein